MTRDVPHVLHLLLTVLCFGFWAIVWILDVITNGSNAPAFRCQECGTDAATSSRALVEANRQQAEAERLNQAIAKQQEDAAAKAAEAAARAEAETVLQTGVCPHCGVKTMQSVELGSIVYSCPSCQRIFNAA
jgi:tRNA(Ile2) C34 agmatinyltransferase TiaS